MYKRSKKKTRKKKKGKIGGRIINRREERKSLALFFLFTLTHFSFKKIYFAI